jgi:hypothetical protein
VAEALQTRIAVQRGGEYHQTAGCHAGGDFETKTQDKLAAAD